MEFEEATQCTQNTPGIVDPRRMGQNNSGLSAADISDVMCILHPCSPAAFTVVASNAQRNANYVLQNDGFQNYNDVLTQSEVEEHETFILDPNAPYQAMDLALRFSVKTKSPHRGFTFGRSPDLCDIVLANDHFKRVSNLHFSIFINSSGVLMVSDMSTNGTIVDDIVLRGGKTKAGNHPQTRMLNPGSIIQILSPRTEDIVKFIVRIPSREGHFEEYQAKFQAHMRYKAAAKPLPDQENVATRRLADIQLERQNSGSIKAPLVRNQHGMHWNGGDRYNVVGLIGKGAFATVYQLATKSDGLLFAAKELEKRRFMKNGILDRKLDNEMKIMKSISHDNIVQYVDYYDHTHHMYIIMEFVPCGDLSKYLSMQERPLSDNFAKSMARQVFDALTYLHKKKITHRDIKPDNILLANLDNFTVKLSDFGLSKVVTDNETFLKTFCGTLLYCAPEVFPHYETHVAGKGRKRTRQSTAQQSINFHGYSQSVDIWSFGAVLWYSLCLKPPFEGVNEGHNGRGMFDQIMLTPLNTSDLVFQGVDDNAIALVVEMLNTDPAMRPTPVSCLRHKWLGIENLAEADAGADDDGLVSIVEEEEDGEEEIDEPDVSGLSLDEQESNSGSHLSEVSIHSGSLDVLDPRQSKRFKSDLNDYRDHPDRMIDSSPEIFYQSIPIIHQSQTDQTAAQSHPARRKLFGEISHSALDSSAVLGTRTTDAVEMSKTSEDQDDYNDSTNNHGFAQFRAPAGALASSGLFGAESMVREFHMDSPRSTNSQDVEPTEPVTPETDDMKIKASLSHTNGRANNIQDDDTTPRQPQRAVFSRQINLPIPASFWYEADDPSTHNLEYASRKSGFDYVANPTYLPPTDDTSLPTTVGGSVTEDEHEQDDTEDAPTLLTSTRRIDMSPPPSQFVKPPPRLGKLTSIPGSFTSVNINLSNRYSTWGRLPSNTHVYPDPHDVRIPKTGIIIMFHAKSLKDFAEDDQAWLRLPDLHCVICTESTQGIYVNGALLKKGERGGKMPYGKIYTGDEIVVVQDHNGKPGLKFTCEFYHGEAKDRRPDGPIRFLVEVEGSVKRPNGKRKDIAASKEVHSAP